MNPKQSGFSYLEVLVATLLIATTLVPIMDALQPGLQGSALHQQNTQIHYTLVGKLEAVLAEPFAELDAAATAAGAYNNPTSYSDTGATIPHQVFIWRYDVDDADTDGDVFTGGEADILWISVTQVGGNQALETLVSQY